MPPHKRDARIQVARSEISTRLIPFLLVEKYQRSRAFGAEAGQAALPNREVTQVEPTYPTSNPPPQA